MGDKPISFRDENGNFVSAADVWNALSPNWLGETDPGKRGWCLLPAWVVACAALLAGILIYLWFAFSLASYSDRLFAEIGGVRLAKAVPPKAGPARFARFLEPEVREGLVTVRDEPDQSVVILRGDGLFASGSGVVLERYIPTLTRIAEALNTVKGSVVVTGYTDNVPIRTAQYPSNFHLSRDRAEHVKAILGRTVNEPSRIRAQGLGESDPVAPNDTPENRARNRRVEIVLLAAPNPQGGQ